MNSTDKTSSKMDGGFFIGGMLGRILGPIVGDLNEFYTPWGKEIAQKKFAKERRAKEAELGDKVKLSKIDHQHKLVSLREQFKLNRENAEKQMVQSYSEWQTKVFWEKCFPLRNPFESPFGVELEYEGTKNLRSCKLQTLQLPNKKEIVPLRVILALKDNSHSHAATVNADLSMFLAQNFSANHEHAVVSEIGAWKDEAPINDASINYLFQGQRGLPTLIITPAYTNGGSIVRFKLWSWGLGENLVYPIGFDFGWFNIDSIYRQILLEEIKDFDAVLSKIKASRPTPYTIFEEDLKIIKLIERNDNLEVGEKNQLMCLLQKTPPELSASVQRKTNEIISNIYSCAVGMYADAYHLTQYGTFPLLPYLIRTMPGTKLVLNQIQQFYMVLFESTLTQGILSYEDAINLELDLYESLKQVGSSSIELKALTKQIRGHLFDAKDKMHCSDSVLQQFNNQAKLLLE